LRRYVSAADIKAEIEIFGRITISIGLAYIRYSAQHSDVFLITSCVRKRRALDALGRLIPIVGVSMINQADQMRGNLIIDRVVSFILSSLIVALPILALLLIKYPLESLWSL
jgi:hypothetical protein